jgi:hypothetical protein
MLTAITLMEVSIVIASQDFLETDSNAQVLTKKCSIRHSRIA